MARTIPCAPSHHRRYTIMAASGNTPHYSLSQFGPDDRPSWIEDYNRDMQKLDTAIFGAKNEATEAKQSATENGHEIQQVSQQMESIQDTMLTADKAETMFATKDELSSMSGGMDMQFYHSNLFQTVQFYSNSLQPVTIKLPPLKKSVGEECTTVDSSGKLVINKTGVYLIDCNFNFGNFSGEAEENFTIIPQISPGYMDYENSVYSYFSTISPGPPQSNPNGPYVSCRVSPIVLTVDTAPMKFYFQVGPLQQIQGARTATYGEASCVVMRLHK